MRTFTSTGIDLSANTTYFFVLDLSSNFATSGIRATNTDNEDSGALAGWSIGNGLLFRGYAMTGAWSTNTPTPKISLGGLVKGTVQLSADTYTVPEASGSGNAWVWHPDIYRFSKTVAGDDSASVSVSDGSAVIGTDYRVFPKNDDRDATVATDDGAASRRGRGFWTYPNAVDAPNKSFTITLTGTLGGILSLGSRTTATITIVDDDPTVVTLARVGSGAVSEGGTVEFTVSLGRALVAGEIIDVPLSIGGTGVTTSDWSLAKKTGSSLNTGVTLSGTSTSTPTVRFSGAGAQTATLVLTPADDGPSEGTETYRIALGSNAAFDASSLGTNVGGGTDPHATSNDFSVQVSDAVVGIAGASLEFSPSALTVMANGMTTYTVKLNKVPSGSVTVALGTSDGNVATVSPTSLTFTPSNWNQARAVSVMAGSLGTATISHAASGGGYGGVSGDVTVTVAAEVTAPPSDCMSATNSRFLGCVWLTGGAAVTEGGAAAFTVHAHPAPRDKLVVQLAVVDPSFKVRSRDRGSRAVAIPKGRTSTTFMVPTWDDGTHEPEGEVRAAMRNRVAVGGTGGREDWFYYWKREPSVARVMVSDNDPAPPVKTYSEHASITLSTETIREDAADPWVNITVTLSRAFERPHAAELKYMICFYSDARRSRSHDQTAAGDERHAYDYRVWQRERGSDWWIRQYQCAMGTFKPGETTNSDIRIQILDDSHEDSGERIRMRLQGVDARRWDRLGIGIAAPNEWTLVILNDETPVEPAVSVSAGSAVTEGGDAVFTLTANPAPAADLPVTVTVGTDGDWGVTAGSRTVTIPTTGSAKLTLATTGDAADEPDGSVSVTVKDGDGYTVGSSGSGTVSVRDDDDPAPACAARQTVVDYLVEVRDNPKNTAVKGNPVHIAKWNRVLEAIGHDTGTGLAAMPVSEIHGNAKKWPASPFKAASDHLNCVAQGGQGQPQQQDPEVTISAGTSPVTEGGDAVFTLTATPAPAADLSVSVTVATDGDWGVTAGSRTVTIPTTGSATLTLATTDDATDEPDGSVTATVQAGSGYTVGSAGSGTVAVSDDDVPPPVVTLAAKAASVSEGGDAVFTLTASPAPVADLPVSVTVAADGAYGITAGTQTVTIPTTGSATLTLATTDDATDEPDGSVTVTVTDGSGYTAGDPASGTVAVRDDDVPAVTVSAGSEVTEGGDAVFTLTASPAPAADLAVSVSVATDGDYGIAAGNRTVTIPTTGSATLTLATTDDSADEPDGSVTATVQAGSGYTVGAAGSGTVAVRDDDLPPPVVTIAANAGSVTEGGDAVFTLTADRAPDADLTVTLAVSETGDGDHVAASDEGPATMVIPKDATEAVFTLATVNDDADEPDGAAVVTVEAGTGYTAGDPASASVEVKDDDVATASALSVGDSTAKEGARLPIMPFTVRLSSPAPGPVRVYVSTRPSTPVSAEPGKDYAPGSYDLTFRVGETEKQVWIRIYDDSHDEGSETFEVVLSNAKGAAIADGVAVGTIVNDDPMPAAFLARFGRTVAEQTLDGIAGRMAAPRTAGMQGAIAGQAVGFGPAESGTPAGGVPSAGAAPAHGEAALAMAGIARSFGNDAGGPGSGTGIGNGFGHDIAGPGFLSGTGGAGFGETPAQSRTMTARDALLGSSFSLTGETDGSGGSMAFWGRAAQGSFDGREGTFSLDGTVTTGMLGADYARGKWLIGLALAQSDGEGDYRDTDVMSRAASQDCPPEAAELCRGAVREGDGTVEASLTAAIPYAAFQASERLKLWGAAGYGAGEVTLKTELGGNYSADTSWSMAAAGLRGDLLQAPQEGSGPALAVTSDALWTRTSSEKTDRLAASESDVTRLRVGLEGSYHVALEDGGSLVPKLELGARHDGGDAETGFGVELGGGVKWTDPGLGLMLDLSGRTLLAHGDDDLKDRGFSAALAYDPAPETGRGVSLSLRQDFGGRAAGGLDALFQPEALEDRAGGGEATSRWAVEAAYGLPAFGGRWTGSPHMGFGLATGARDYSLGWRLAPEAANAPDLSFGVRATRRESDAAKAEHTFGIELTARW